MKTIAMLGATGKSGRYVLRELLAKGYHVRVLVRRSLSEEFCSAPQLISVRGDAMSEDSMKELLAGADALVSTIGHVKGADPWLCTHVMQTVLKMSRPDFRIIALTGSGAFVPEDRPGLLDRLLRKLILLLDPARVHDGQEMVDVLQKSNASWTVIRTPLQLSIPAYFPVITGYLGYTWHIPFVSRPHIAKSMLRALEDEVYLCEAPVISGL